MTSSNFNFTKALNRLEEIVARLEDPDLDLEEGLKLLEEGVNLHKLCHHKLTKANVKIKTILKEDDQMEDIGGDLKK